MVEINWATTVYCWRCEAYCEKKEEKRHSYCGKCGQQIVHGPRATIIAPLGRTLLAFDADALHYRIAACLSQDQFINESLSQYDKTRDPIWKPHVRNCAALFGISPEEAVKLMYAESNKYVFAKNFIYMLLNGGEAPALANAAAMTGLKLSVGEVSGLVKRFLAQAVGFDRWRQGLVREAEETGQIRLACGRRRRFYALRMKQGKWVVDEKTRKEIYNFPLIGTEVTFVNPRIEKVWHLTQGTEWKLVCHAHDGFLLEGPEGEVEEFSQKALAVLNLATEIKPGMRLYVPWAGKSGRCWAMMK